MKIYRTHVDLEHRDDAFWATKALAFSDARTQKHRADFVTVYVDQLEAPTTQAAIIAYLSGDHEDLKVTASWRLTSTGGMTATDPREAT